jgi:hypothetical protein
MNPLDELLSSAGQVPGISPTGLGKARAALDAAIAEGVPPQNATMRQPGPPADRRAASHWWGSVRRSTRGRTAVGITAAMVVAAAAATTVALPSQPPHPKAAPRANSAIPASARPVSYTFTATTDVTAAYVLDKAAQAAQTARAGSMSLVKGWPNATYWHTLSQSTNSACPGQVETSNTWLAKAGFAIGDNTVAGPKSSDSLSACGDGGAVGLYSIAGQPAGVQIGGRIYTWPAFAALPTDPARLWPIIKADANVGVAPGKGGLTFDFQTIGVLLSSDPVSPAMRQALYKALEKIPGVTVAGTYTDSLGRTGTALRLGSWTFVVDSGDGRVLAQLTGAPPVPPGCVRSSLTGGTRATCQVSGASVTVFITAAPAASAPKVKGFSTASFVMPSVIGDTARQAVLVLTKAGIGSVGYKATATRPSAPAGVVVSQSPAAGTTVAPGTQANITVKP